MTAASVESGPLDAAIVLGARLTPAGAPSAALERRVLHAVGLARAGEVAHLLMTGGPVGHPRPEAAAMRDLALGHGIAADRLVVEDRARNTIENVRFCLPIIAARGWRRLAVVTDSYHLPRALYVFRRLGLVAVPVAAGRPGGRCWPLWLREAAALPWTVLRVEGRRALDAAAAVIAGRAV